MTHPPTPQIESQLDVIEAEMHSRRPATPENKRAAEKAKLSQAKEALRSLLGVIYTNADESFDLNQSVDPVCGALLFCSGAGSLKPVLPFDALANGKQLLARADNNAISCSRHFTTLVPRPTQDSVITRIEDIREMHAAEKERHTEEMEALATELAEAKQALATVAVNAAEWEQAKEEITSLRAEIERSHDAAADSLAKFQQSFQETEAAKAALHAAHERAAELFNHLTEAEAVRDEAVSSADAAQSQLVAVTKELADTNDRVSALAAALDEKESMVAEVATAFHEAKVCNATLL